MKKVNTANYEYSNETFSGCDMTASLNIRMQFFNTKTRRYETKIYTKILGELQTVSYSIHMEKRPVRSIGNVNAKDYVIGPRTIAGSLVFSVFNKHFSKDILENLNGNYTAGTAYLVDELPPFDITISAANEYGYRSRLVIYGVRLLTEGQVMSINDVYTENTYQFFATDLEYLTDEMKYIRSNNRKLFKLKDYINWYEPKNTIIKGGKLKYIINKSEIADREKRKNRPITMSVIATSPATVGKKGQAEFFLDPPQDNGKIYIKDKDCKKNLFIITVSANNKDEKINNKHTYFSIKLQDGSYSAKFQNSNGRESNLVKFNINKINAVNKLDYYAPIIEEVKTDRIKVYSNEPCHDRVKIAKYTNKNIKDFKFYKIKNRRTTILNLEPNTQYIIETENSLENIPSKSIICQTFSKGQNLFNSFENLVYANSSFLIFKDLQIYKRLINDLKNFSVSDSDNISDKIKQMKDSYVAKYKALKKEQKDYDLLKAAYDLNIKACSELLSISLKQHNDFIKTINKKSDIKIPNMFYDNNYNNVFNFDKKTEKAEFFKIGKHIEQLRTTATVFKNINSNSKCFRFLDSPGKYYVQAIYKNKRSPKLEFCIMTQQEKENYILNDLKYKKQEQNNIKEFKRITELYNLDENKERIYMLKTKTIDNPIIPPPHIDSVTNCINVQTIINHLLRNGSQSSFYIAVASYEDIIKHKYNYKTLFNNTTETIALNECLNNLEEEKNYCLWIEDENNIQISNPVTIFYKQNFDIKNDDFENKSFNSIIDFILDSANRILPAEVNRELFSLLKNNNDITSYNYIEKILGFIFLQILSKEQLINFLKEIKFYIGPFVQSCDCIQNIRKHNKLSFFSDLNGNIVIYGAKANSDISNCYSFPIQHDNVIDYENLDEDLLLVFVVDKDLKIKSDFIIINKIENYYEVI